MVAAWHLPSLPNNIICVVRKSKVQLVNQKRMTRLVSKFFPPSGALLKDTHKQPLHWLSSNSCGCIVVWQSYLVVSSIARSFAFLFQVTESALRGDAASGKTQDVAARPITGCRAAACIFLLTKLKNLISQDTQQYER